MFFSILKKRNFSIVRICYKCFSMVFFILKMQQSLWQFEMIKRKIELHQDRQFRKKVFTVGIQEQRRICLRRKSNRKYVYAYGRKNIMKNKGLAPNLIIPPSLSLSLSFSLSLSLFLTLSLSLSHFSLSPVEALSRPVRHWKLLANTYNALAYNVLYSWTACTTMITDPIQRERERRGEGRDISSIWSLIFLRKKAEKELEL